MNYNTLAQCSQHFIAGLGNRPSRIATLTCCFFAGVSSIFLSFVHFYFMSFSTGQSNSLFFYIQIIKLFFASCF